MGPGALRVIEGIPVQALIPDCIIEDPVESGDRCLIPRVYFPVPIRVRHHRDQVPFRDFFGSSPRVAASGRKGNFLPYCYRAGVRYCPGFMPGYDPREKKRSPGR